ncbi:MFS transporter [Sphaerisporangium sp. NPDC004334]
MFGTSIPISMIKGSMILYYVDILGLDVRAYGVVMVVYAVIDAFDNPLLGHLSDRTRSRFGRRRPWLLVGAPMLTACMIAFFSAPASLRGAGLVISLAVTPLLTTQVFGTERSTEGVPDHGGHLRRGGAGRHRVHGAGRARESALLDARAADAAAQPVVDRA